MAMASTPSAFTKSDTDDIHAPELTIGSDVMPTQCACYYAGSTWHDGAMAREYHLEQNPDCPLHWAKSRLAPCICRYVDGWSKRGVHWWQPIAAHYAGSWFVIDRDCPHHGDAALATSKPGDA